jgi:hypothetical protein
MRELPITPQSPPLHLEGLSEICAYYGYTGFSWDAVYTHAKIFAREFTKKGEKTLSHDAKRHTNKHEYGKKYQKERNSRKKPPPGHSAAKKAKKP